ncbi:unnamed protein product [Gordionus sp. m RMFG-2023]
MSTNDSSFPSGDSHANTTSHTTESAPTSAGSSSWGQFLVVERINIILWILRLITLVSGFFFLFPLIGKQTQWYQRILLCNGAINALRLHTRLPRFRPSREFLANILTEDSCHNLIYSMIFLFSSQITLVIVPPVLYALLHSIIFSVRVLDAFRLNVTAVRNMMSKVTLQQISLLRIIACTEIFLMPAIIASVFVGKGNLFVPFMYYRFLTLRYAARRNPYCRMMFSEMKMAILELSSNPRCPAFVRGLVYQIISFLGRLAPPISAAN